MPTKKYIICKGFSMNLIQKAFNSYIRKEKFWQNRQDKAEKLVEELEKDMQEQIEMQKQIISKCYEKSPFWANEIVRPVINEIEKMTGLIHDSHDPERGLIPMGMKARVSVFFYKKRLKNGKLKTVENMLVFVPHSNWKKPEEFQITLETNKTEDGKPHNEFNINDLNGFSIIEEPMPKTINGIIKFMRKNSSRGNC